MTLGIMYLTSTRPKLSKNVYLIIPSSLFTTIFFLNGQKQCVNRAEIVIL